MNIGRTTHRAQHQPLRSAAGQGLRLALYRRRGARFALAVAFAYGLAEAMLVIAWARNWQISWWEWHLLMLTSFIVIAAVARSEWHEERYSALYLDRTLAGARDVSVLLADLSGFTAFAAAHPQWPRFRTGVNSGEVVAAVVGGPSGHRKHGVVGDTVNLAARLETAALPGTVVIGEATYRRLGAGVVAERVPPLQVKGKRDPIHAYVLLALPAGMDSKG